MGKFSVHKKKIYGILMNFDARFHCIVRSFWMVVIRKGPSSVLENSSWEKNRNLTRPENESVFKT